MERIGFIGSFEEYDEALEKGIELAIETIKENEE